MKHIIYAQFVCLVLLVSSCHFNEPAIVSGPKEPDVITPVSATSSQGTSYTLSAIPRDLTVVGDEGPLLNPPINSRIKSITINYNDYVTEAQLRAKLANPETIRTKYEHVETFTYAANGKAVWPRTRYEKNMMIRLSIDNYTSTKQYSDTLFLNSLGYVENQVAYHRNVAYRRPFIYDKDHYLLSETYYTINACGYVGYLEVINQKHTISSGNRISSEMDASNLKEKFSVQYTFDNNRLNSGISFDMLRMASGCGRKFMLHGDPKQAVFGKYNKNIIRTAVAKNEKEVTTNFFYRYAFDDKGRVKRVLVFFANASPENGVIRPYGIDMREYEYYD